MAERMDYAPALPSPSDQHDARNLLAWAQRIMAGFYGTPRSQGYRSAVDSWQANYLPWQKNLLPMPSRELVPTLSVQRTTDGGE